MAHQQSQTQVCFNASKCTKTVTANDHSATTSGITTVMWGTVILGGVNAKCWAMRHALGKNLLSLVVCTGSCTIFLKADRWKCCRWGWVGYLEMLAGERVQQILQISSSVGSCNLCFFVPFWWSVGIINFPLRCTMHTGIQNVIMDSMVHWWMFRRMISLAFFDFFFFAIAVVLMDYYVACGCHTRIINK